MLWRPHRSVATCAPYLRVRLLRVFPWPLVELPLLVVPGLNTKLCTSGPATLVPGGNSRPRNLQAGGV